MPPAPLARAVDAALEASVVLSFSRVGHAVRSRLEGWDDPHHLNGTGRRVLVTGANSGLGYATARRLLSLGAEVLLTVRDHAKGEDTLARLSTELGSQVAARASYDLLDLDDLASVRRFAADRRAEDLAIDALVHNAGAMFATRQVTVDGLERTYQVHVVAPLLLTALLLPALSASAPSRVITVTSGGMYAQRLDTERVDSPDGYRPSVAYARAKRAQVALTEQWAHRFGHTGIGFFAAHPGWALTPGVEASLPGFRRLTGPILRDPDQGADTVVQLALADGLDEHTGRLWHDRRPRSQHKVPWTVSAPDEADRLWARVCRDAEVTPSLPAR
ncbi:MAG: SDR family NAD(P)-dependent oxidoreductase [Nitriliruptoraceae bacterium]